MALPGPAASPPVGSTPSADPGRPEHGSSSNVKHHRRAMAIFGVLAACTLTSCGGSSSAAAVCDDYEDVASEIADDDVASAFNGEIFDALDNLAKEVKDFDDEPELQATGEDMLDMANDDSASIEEVEEMIAPVKEFCATR